MASGLLELLGRHQYSYRLARPWARVTSSEIHAAYDRLVTPELTTALLTGFFALAGALGGVLLRDWVSRRADERRIAAEDARRWLGERRHIYAAYLGLAESLNEIDRVALLTFDNGSDPLDEEEKRDLLFDYFQRWEEEVQPSLGEVQLIATSAVTDLADRVSGTLMELTANIEARGSFDDHYPAWFQARDLLQVLRNAMREELGLSPVEIQFPRSRSWPWLPDRPPRESYIQDTRERKL